MRKRSLSVFALLLTAVLLLSVCGSVSAQDEAPAGQVRVIRGCNVRSGPDSSFEKLGMAKEGDKYPCYGYVVNPDTGDSWYRIIFKEKTGYIALSMAEPYLNASLPLLEDGAAGSSIDLYAEDLMTRGKIIRLGRYPQTVTGDDKTPIEWLVLEYDMKNDRALIISCYGLDSMGYHSGFVGTDWENCALRRWMNTTFPDRAFNVEEKALILTVDVKNSNDGVPAEYWSGTCGNDTKDRIFVLDYEEAQKYFGVNGLDPNMDSRLSVTDYAIRAGVHLDTPRRTKEEKAAAVWWLRNSAFAGTYAAAVDDSGAAVAIPVNTFPDVAVRPAMWIDVSALPERDPGRKAALKQVPQTGRDYSMWPETAAEKAAREAAEAAAAIANAPLFLSARPEPAAVPPAEPATRQNCVPGAYVSFGAYEQDNDESNGREPIDWLVLSCEGGRAMLISRYGLDARPFNEVRQNTSWGASTLRAWLNSDFLSAAFSESEQQAIPAVTVKNGQSQGYRELSLYYSADTQDRVYILSFAEAEKYFGRIDNRFPDAMCNVKSRVSPTDYAAAQGGGKGHPSFRTMEDRVTGRYWLRSPSDQLDEGLFVETDGSVAIAPADCGYILVRPVIWLDLNALPE